MAIVQLKNDDKTSVEVTRLDNSGFGLLVVEKTVSGERTFTQRYKLWFKEPHGLAVGQTVNVSGFLGAKVGDPWNDKNTGEERRSVELSINQPRIDGSVTAAANSDEPF
jgi:hypothetical protein